MTDKLRIFIGWDSREPIAYDVAKATALENTSVPLDIQPIKLDDLIAKGAYTREVDPLASTEFTYSRFYTPWLAGYEGWALFCDCDFIFFGDVGGLLKYRDPSKAVYCVGPGSTAARSKPRPEESQAEHDGEDQRVGHDAHGDRGRQRRLARPERRRDKECHEEDAETERDEAPRMMGGVERRHDQRDDQSDAERIGQLFDQKLPHRTTSLLPALAQHRRSAEPPALD